MLHQADGPSVDMPIGVYDLGFEYNVEIHWFPAIIERFSDQNLEIAVKIRNEIDEIGSFMIFMHQFEFEGEWVMIATSFDEEKDVISVDADLVAREDEVGAVLHDGKEKPVVMPVPASAAKNDLH